MEKIILELLDGFRNFELSETETKDRLLLLLQPRQEVSEDNMKTKEEIINFALEAVTRHDPFAETIESKNLFKCDDKWLTIDEMFFDFFGSDQETSSLREKLKEKEGELDRVLELWENQRKTIERFHNVSHKHFGYDNDADSEFLDKQLQSQSKLIESLAGTFRINESWSLVDVLNRLVTATDKLLVDKGYDGNDYEEMQICSDIAKKLILGVTKTLTEYNNYKNKQNGNN